MSESAAENLIETGSIPEGKVSVENAIADMGKAATLAEWVYAGLRIETKDWSAELRKSSDVQLPKFALLENAVEQTGSIQTEATEHKLTTQKQTGSSVGISNSVQGDLDQTLSSVRDAKVMGLDGFRLNVTQENAATAKSNVESFARFGEIALKPVSTVEVETPVIEEVAVEPVVEEVVAEVQAEIVAAPVETPVIEEVAVEPVVEEVVAEVQDEIVAAPVETPVIEEVAVEPVVEEVAKPESDLNFGRLYFHDFDSSRAKIVIQSDFITSFEDLIVYSDVYQDEASSVIELDNGSDLIILTQFAKDRLTADMFVFEPASQSSDLGQVFVRENPVVAEEAVASDVFNFGLGSGRIYVTEFDVSKDKIFIKADLFSNFDEMISRIAVYQNESSAVLELHDSADMIILPHFSVENISKDMFVFEANSVSINEVMTDIKFGTSENETMIFGAGDQMIDPSLGFDVVTGGEGHDTFIFGANSGHDFLVDFKAGEDHIQIGSDLAQDFTDLMDRAAIYQDGSATQIEFAGGQLITLYGVDAKTASAEWFSFS